MGPNIFFIQIKTQNLEYTENVLTYITSNVTYVMIHDFVIEELGLANLSYAAGFIFKLVKNIIINLVQMWGKHMHSFSVYIFSPS